MELSSGNQTDKNQCFWRNSFQDLHETRNSQKCSRISRNFREFRKIKFSRFSCFAKVIIFAKLAKLDDKNTTEHAMGF